MSFTKGNRILLVDDHVDDITWLIDVLEWRGYRIDQVTNEEAARRRIGDIAKGEDVYALAIIDIMVSTKDIMELSDLDSGLFYGQSRDTGIRLCRYARKELGIPEEQLPIVCISARDDDELKETLGGLGIRLFSRTPQDSGDSIRHYLAKKLNFETQE